MSLDKNEDANRHTIKTKLFPNHLEHTEGKYIARTVNEKTLTIDDIVADMKQLDGYTGSKDVALGAIHSYLRTRNFRLCDGYAVSDGFTTSYLHIGGTFESPNDPLDPNKHKITMRYISHQSVREMIKKEVKVEVLEVAHNTGSIHFVLDLETDMPHNLVSSGQMIAIHGDKIKIAGEHTDNGVYFVPVLNPTAKVKMTRIGDNHAGRIVGIAPEFTYAEYTLEIRTQYSGGSSLMKEPRVISGNFTITSI